MSLIKSFITAIYGFHNYPNLIKNKTSKTILYYILFTILIMILSIAPLARLYLRAGGLTGIADKYIPNFKIENGKLSCTTVDSNNEGLRIYINTTDEFDFESVINDSQFYIVADSDKYAMSNSIQTETGKFTDFVDFSKESFMDIISSKTFKISVFSIGFLSLFVSFIISGLINIFIVALIGNLINGLAVKAQLGFGSIFKLSIYVRTFPILLSTALPLFGIELHYIVFLGLIITYMYFGLKYCKGANGIIIAELNR